MKIGKQGMLLLEVACAVSIVMLLSGAVYMSANVRKANVDSFARRMCSDIRYVRMRNIYGDDTAKIKFQTDSKGRCGYTLYKEGVLEKEEKLPGDVRFTSTLGTLDFTLAGTLKGSGDTIRITDAATGYTKVVTVVPFSGRTLIREGIYAYE